MNSWIKVKMADCTVIFLVNPALCLCVLKQTKNVSSVGADVAMRIRRGLWLVLSMLSLSVLLVVLGAYTTTRTESLNVTGYASGVVVNSLFTF